MPTTIKRVLSLLSDKPLHRSSLFFGASFVAWASVEYYR